MLSLQSQKVENVTRETSRDHSTASWFGVTLLLRCVRDLYSLLFIEGRWGKEDWLCFRFGLSKSHGEMSAKRALYKQQ